MNHTQYKLLMVKFLALSGIAIMSIAIAYAITQGNFAKEGAILTNSPWGILTLVDVYVGIVLFSCWIAMREERVLTAGLWIGTIMVLGNIVSCFYLFIALVKARGNKEKLLLGHSPA